MAKDLKMEKMQRKVLNVENNLQLEKKENQTSKNHKPLKYILYYNPFFGQEDYFFGFGQEMFTQQCEVKNCYTTNKKSFLGKWKIVKYLHLLLHFIWKM